MDSAQATTSGLTTSDWLAILALCMTVIGALLGVVYSNIMRAIEKLGDAFRGHVEDDQKLTARVDNHAQRLAILDGEKD